ncbi:MAG TPA: methyltransferase domain-containing protein [Solirubrobacterales bacterium]|jgi:trans-aconitate 2-methyltransferase
MSAKPRDWDAATYDRVAKPQEEWARGVIDRLELAGDETVLDAGCGSGRVTRLLLDRLPRGRVIGVDGSPSMIAKAREALGDDAELIVSDLLDLSLSEPVDVVFSNATFHWILDHRQLFARLRAALVPGGRMEAQCGGIGNVEEFLNSIENVNGDERFGSYLRGVTSTWNFASPGDTEMRLADAGFDPARCWLEDAPVQPRDPRAFIETVCLGAHLDRLPPELRPSYMDAVLEVIPRPLTLDYVRLNISARRP